jgi:outer membrane protein TolC
VLARIGHKQSKVEFERRIHELLFAVEEAYWGLYCAYWDLYGWDNGLRQVQHAWQIAKQRFDAKGLAEDDLAQIEETYHFFRNQRLEALGRGQGGRPGVLEAERRLRYVTGMPSEDGTRLIPSDLPLSSRVEPDWKSALQIARERRPELQQIYNELQSAELQVFRAKDYLKPDLRFVSKAGTNGLADSLAGSYHDFYNWELGLLMEVPIGYRAGNAEVERAKLQLAQRYAFLRDQEKKLMLSLQRSYRDLIQFREQLQIRRSQREAAAVQLRTRFERFKSGKRLPGDVDLLVRTQRNWVDALREEYQVLCKYNVALADFERQKGTILNYRNVQILESGFPSYSGAGLCPVREHSWTENTGPGAVDLAISAPASLDGPEPLLPALTPSDASSVSHRPEFLPESTPELR